MAAAAADDRLPHFWVWQEQKCFNKGVKRSKVARLHMVSFCQDDDDKGKEVLDWVRFDLVIQRFMVIIFSRFRIFMTATT